jgi:non-heme chloroperoxidase
MDLETLPRQFFTTPDGTRLAYVDLGSGPPIVLLHGWSSSMNWFKEQIDYFVPRYRVLALEFRGHGDSDKAPSGHTMEQYAQDVHDFVEAVGARDCLMVGWSMASFVLWKYFERYGRDQALGMVFLGQSASDLRSEKYPGGIVTLDEFYGMMHRLQTERDVLLPEWMRAMRMHATDEQVAWMAAEYARCPAHIATIAFYFQTMVDCFDIFGTIDFPTRVFFGTDPGMYHIEDGEYLAGAIPGTKLVVFDQSGHIPMLEEPEKFNRELEAFARELFVGR